MTKRATVTFSDCFNTDSKFYYDTFVNYNYQISVSFDYMRWSLIIWALIVTKFWFCRNHISWRKKSQVSKLFSFQDIICKIGFNLIQFVWPQADGEITNIELFHNLEIDILFTIIFKNSFSNVNKYLIKYWVKTNKKFVNTEMPFHSIVNSTEENTCSRHATITGFCWPNLH